MPRMSTINSKASVPTFKNAFFGIEVANKCKSFASVSRVTVFREVCTKAFDVPRFTDSKAVEFKEFLGALVCG